MSYLHISNAMLVTAVLASEQAHLCEFRGKNILPAEPLSSRDGGSAAKNFPRTCTSEPARRLLLFTWKWNLEAVLLNNEMLSLVNTKFPTKKIANCSPYFTILQVISNLETQRSYKITVNLKNLKLVKNLSSGSQIIYQNVYKTANKSVSINTILLSRNRLKLSPWFFTHVIKNVETTINYEGKLHFKSASI